MNKPQLDSRTRKELIEELRRRAASYTPEWSCSGDPEDPGTALLEVFVEMYSHTLDRFNGLPDKYYTEFLNMLGVSEPDALSASGYARFDINNAADKAVVIPERTLLAATDPETKTGLVYETLTRIEATPAKLRSVLYFDPEESLLQKMDLRKSGQNLFGPVDGENLNAHILVLSNNEVLTDIGDCTVYVELHEETSFKDQYLNAMLADKSVCTWKWYDGENWVPFEEVSLKPGSISLHKLSDKPFCKDENGRICVRAELNKVDVPSVLKEVLISSSSNDSIPVRDMAYQDLPLEGGKGFCFGQTPGIYDLFYLREDSVFCKKGADIALNMHILTEAVETVDSSQAYDWTKDVINKNDMAMKISDDVVIRRVIWEYFNGDGWAPLQVKGDCNPFLPSEREKVYTLSFQVPEDVSSAIVNSVEGYYIRARIAEIDNMLSQNPRWMLPYVKETSCRWSYSKGCRCDYISALNDGNVVELEEAAKIDDLDLNAFYPTVQTGRSIYFCFDKSPDALPLTLFFGLRDKGDLPGKISVEALVNGTFSSVRMTDGTDNFRLTGILRLYLTQKLTRESLFGEDGYWIRLSCEGWNRKEYNLPKIDRLDVNVTRFIQYQHAEQQTFDTGPYDKNKEIQLLNTPVQNEEVWVNETGRLTAEEIRNLKKADGVYLEIEENQETVQLVRWKRTKDIRLCAGNDRVYEMNSGTGVIHFGDGSHGMFPPEGADSIRVDYAYGGGTEGNKPAGAVSDLITAIPMVDAVTNITSVCGGTGSGSREWLESVGTLHLKHRGRALGADDFEAIIRESFPRVHSVRCFRCRNEQGEYSPGHVTVVFFCSEVSNLADTEAMAEEMYHHLSECSDCVLQNSGRLHVLPATEICISVEARVQLENLNYAADTQQKLNDEISSLIDNVWRKRGIGERIQIEELYQLITQTPNVDSILNLMVQGSWTENGVEMVCNMAEKQEFQYSTVHSGLHTIRVQ